MQIVSVYPNTLQSKSCLKEFTRQNPDIRIKKINTSQGFPWQPGIQPVSRGWIGLDAEARRGDTPIRQVL